LALLAAFAGLAPGIAFDPGFTLALLERSLSVGLPEVPAWATTLRGDLVADLAPEEVAATAAVGPASGRHQSHANASVRTQDAPGPIVLRAVRGLRDGCDIECTC
jgi:hypothetical protein